MQTPRRLLCLLLAAGVLATLPAQSAATAETTFDVRNGDQKGKLTIRENELAFDSLTDAKHSRTWKYSEIRGLEKKLLWNTLRVRPFSGSRYDFQFSKKATRDTIFDTVSQRIVAARAQKTK